MKHLEWNTEGEEVIGGRLTFDDGVLVIAFAVLFVKTVLGEK